MTVLASCHTLERAFDNRCPFEAIKEKVSQASTVAELISAAMLLKKARSRADIVSSSKKLKIGVLGGYTFSPLCDLIDVQLWARGYNAQILCCDFSDDVAPFLETSSKLSEFGPELILFYPALTYPFRQGEDNGSDEKIRVLAKKNAEFYALLCRQANERWACDIIMMNFVPGLDFDAGALRSRNLTSEWSYTKLLNLELGLAVPSCVQICDLEFLASMIGLKFIRDDRAWLESRQPGSGEFLCAVSKEIVFLACARVEASRKILVLDADNTLWGGVLAEDGVAGIELGHNSPKAEAFVRFQRYIRFLKQRGVLLALCSKNDSGLVHEVLESHPEMVLHLEDFVSIKANWSAKSDNLKEISSELGLALDSMVFVDDNPAEIEIVRQQAPDVQVVLLGEDPSEHVSRLQKGRYFESRVVTQEDISRTEAYQAENKRKLTRSTASDMNVYLKSLEMVAEVRSFSVFDLIRLSQLMNKSNQFNLTTRRYSEEGVRAVVSQGDARTISVRLKDKFGDYGLIASVVGRVVDKDFVIENWCMSCRVLQRQVEEITLNEIFYRAAAASCQKVRGIFIETSKNGMVKSLYSRLSFLKVNSVGEKHLYERDIAGYLPFETFIVVRREEVR